MISIAGLVADREGRTRVLEALHLCARVVFANDLAELCELVVAPAPWAIISELHDRTGRSLATILPVVRARAPFVRVVAYCYLDQEAAQALVMAARAGLDDIIIRPKDQAAALRHAVLTRSTSGHVAQVVGAALDARLPPYSRRVIQYCLDHAGESLAVVKAAAALGVHRKTLVDRLAREGSPPPSTLIGWSRLLLAVHVLETSTCSIEALALQLGFSSGAALHNMLKRYTGRRAAELRSAGALKAVIDQLCRAYRSTTTPDPEFARASEQATRVSELSEPIAHREPGSVMPAALRWAPDPENGEHQDAQAALPRDRESDVA